MTDGTNESSDLENVIQADYSNQILMEESV